MRRVAQGVIAVSALLAVGIGGCGGHGAGAGGGTQFSIVDLGNLNVRGLNQRGDLVGFYPGYLSVFTPLPQKGILRSASGAITELLTTDGTWASFAQGVSNNGLVAGSTANATEWVNGVAVPLPLPTDPNFPETLAWSINSKGQVLGFSFSSDPASPEEAVYWSSATASPVTITPNGFQPVRLIDSGLALGYVSTPAGNELYEVNVSTGTAATDLHVSAQQAAPFYIAIAMNDLGTIVCSTGASLNLIEISPDGIQKQILTSATGTGINNLGDIVGVVQGYPNEAYVYTRAKGVVNLNALLPAHSTWQLVTPLGINDLGQVFGEGVHNGNPASFILQLPTGYY